MKRIICLAMALLLVVSLLSGCGKKKGNKKDTSSSSPSSSAVSSGQSDTSSTAATPVPATPAPQKAKAVKVNAPDGLNIRSRPSTDSEILGLAEDKSKLPLLLEAPSDGWYEVEYQSKSAYVSAEFVTVVDVTLEEYTRLKSTGGVASPEAATESAASSESGDTDPQSSSSASAGEDGE